MSREVKLRFLAAFILLGLGLWGAAAGQWLGGIALMLWAAWINTGIEQSMKKE